MTQNRFNPSGARNAAGKTIAYDSSLTLSEVVHFCCRNASGSTCDIAYALLRHAESYAGREVLVRDCSSVFVGRLIRYMQRQKLSDGTIRTYMERLRVLLRSVQGWSDVDFSQQLPPRSRSRKAVLSADDVQRLRAVVRAGHRYADVGRVFLFSLQTALRFSDIVQLDWSHIRNFGSGCSLCKPMQKTGQMVTVSLTDTACALLREQLGGASLSRRPRSGRVFKGLPSYTTALYRLKQLGRAADCSIPDLTFHVARHTFASALYRGSVPVATISKLLGHSNLAVTEAYIHSFLTDEWRALQLMDEYGREGVGEGARRRLYR